MIKFEVGQDLCTSQANDLHVAAKEKIQEREKVLKTSGKSGRGDLLGKVTQTFSIRSGPVIKATVSMVSISQATLSKVLLSFSSSSAM